MTCKISTMHYLQGGVRNSASAPRDAQGPEFMACQRPLAKLPTSIFPSLSAQICVEEFCKLLSCTGDLLGRSFGLANRRQAIIITFITIPRVHVGMPFTLSKNA